MAITFSLSMFIANCSCEWRWLYIDKWLIVHKTSTHQDIFSKLCNKTCRGFLVMIKGICYPTTTMLCTLCNWTIFSRNKIRYGFCYNHSRSCKYPWVHCRPRISSCYSLLWKIMSCATAICRLGIAGIVSWKKWERWWCNQTVFCD